MSHKTKKLLVLGLLAIITSVQAAVPNEYKPNYQIQEDYDQIVNELFVEIQAKSQVGQTIDPSVFAQLHSKFQNVFPHLPSQYSYNVIYQQCLDISNTLSKGYNYNTLVSFMDNCFKPLTTTIENINKNFSVQAKGSINPNSGPAPLTVTLDARASSDPSNQTIPADNFFRYYRDINGIDRVIGKGQVLSYTFDEPGNYRVHLTVRSSNNKAEGILDGTQSFAVDVAPKSANIVVYANGQKLEKFKKVKIGLQEAQRGIVLDGAATQARGGRQILGHNREIKGPNNINLTRQGLGNPSVLKAVLPDQGEYQVVLTTQDNQNNSASETYSIIVSDPVAIIKYQPEGGSTASLFSFDAGASYSIISRLRLFTRELFDQDGNKIETFQGKSVKKQFKKPGTYTIKLTAEDELGQENIETLQLLVESSAPIPQFHIIPRYERSKPSEFILDAAATSDIDTTNGNDVLTYQREFSNPNAVEIRETQNNNQRMIVAFNEIGEHKVKLLVSDQYGKVSEIEKIINVESTLRPIIIVNPTAGVRNNPVTFVVQSNKNLVNYNRDFGDNTSRTVQSNSLNHTYTAAGIYTVTLRVNAGNDENELTTLVFAGEQDSPIPAYRVTSQNLGITMTQNDFCPEFVDGKSVTHPAYRIERYMKFSIDTSESVNTAGQKKDLSIYFQPRNSDILRPSGTFGHSFNELGCQYIDLTVEDTAINKNAKVKIRFKVINDLPSLDNIILSFPQFGNEAGIGLQQQGPVDIFNSDYDPLIVKVSATNTRDNDGFISYYQRYYYYKDDPNRILGTKISPSTIPYTYFSLPRIPGEFAFGVKLVDNDDGYVRSEDIIGQSPVVFFPPDTTRPDIPIVTLRVNTTNVEVGEEVTFEVVSRVLSDRLDFANERVIQYDLDGDGTYDITTKKDSINYVYTKVNEEGFTPRASVLYRGYRGVGVGDRIIVKNALKPRLLFTTKGNIALFRDLSIGDIQYQEICLDVRSCALDKQFLVTTGTQSGFLFTYPEYGKFVINMDLIDKNGNTANKKRPIIVDTGTSKQVVDIISIPEIDTSNQQNEIYVGNNLNNSVLYYFKNNNNAGQCYIDLDINKDSDQDGQKGNDKELNCDTLYLKVYQPQYDKIIGRIFFEQNGSLTSQDFSITFLDFDVQLTTEQKELYELLNQLLQSIDESIPANKELKNMVSKLQNSILDQTESKAIVVDIQDYMQREQENILLSSDEQETLQQIITKLKDGATAAALGEGIYEQAKANILTVLPSDLQNMVSNLFVDFETATGDAQTSLRQAQQEILQQILSTIGTKVATNSDNVTADQVNPLDMELIITPNICTIANFYNIPTQNCNNEDLRPVPEDVTDEADTNTQSSGTGSIIRIILTILGILLGLFILLVIIFAVRAKMRNKTEQETQEVIIPNQSINTITPEPTQTDAPQTEQTPSTSEAERTTQDTNEQTPSTKS